MPQGGGVSHCGLFPSGALGKGLYKLPITMVHSAPCCVCAHICMDGDSMGRLHRAEDSSWNLPHFTQPPGNQTQVTRFTWRTPSPAKPSCHPVSDLQIFFTCLVVLCSRLCVSSHPDLISLRWPLSSQRLLFVVALGSVYWACGVQKGLKLL